MKQRFFLIVALNSLFLNLFSAASSPKPCMDSAPGQTKSRHTLRSTLASRPQANAFTFGPIAPDAFLFDPTNSHEWRVLATVLTAAGKVLLQAENALKALGLERCSALQTALQDLRQIFGHGCLVAALRIDLANATLAKDEMQRRQISFNKLAIEAYDLYLRTRGIYPEDYDRQIIGNVLKVEFKEAAILTLWQQRFDALPEAERAGFAQNFTHLKRLLTKDLGK